MHYHSIQQFHFQTFTHDKGKHFYTETYMQQMFVTAVFIIAQTRKHPKALQPVHCSNCWTSCDGTILSDNQVHTTEPHDDMVNLKGTVLRQRSQTRKAAYYGMPCVSHSGKENYRKNEPVGKVTKG